jgi:predicted permease
MLKDIVFGVRILMRTKAWAAMVVLSLALGIGANTALFSAVNALALRTLPVDDPSSLMRLRHVGRNEMSQSVSEYGAVERPGGIPVGTTFPYPIYRELRAANQTLVDLVAGAPSSQVNVVVDGNAEIASGYTMSGNFCSLLGVQAALGRTITPDDDQPSAQAVAVVSHGFWTRRFGRDPGILGKVVHVNDTPVTIVGVLSPTFTGVQRAVATPADISFPLALDGRINTQAADPKAPPRLGDATYYWLQIIGRLKPGVTSAQVEGNLGGVFQQAARAGFASALAAMPAEEQQSSMNRDRKEVSRLQVSSAAAGLYDNTPTDLRGVAVLSVVVALILLIVCANVANLQLSRAAARQREISVRLSLGATRPRLVRQLLTESVVLAVAGAAVGLLIAYWGRQLLPGPAAQAPMDWRVLVFTGVLALVTAIVFGTAPALRATGRIGLSDALKESSRTVAGPRALLGKTLLVVQVAVSLVLLIGAGLFLRTVENLRRVDVGFNPQNLVLFRVNPQLNRYDSTRIASLYDRMTEHLQAVPGVRAVTLSNPPLLSGSVNGTSFVVQGRPYTRGPHNDISRVRIASNFFETMGMSLLTGRAFTDADNFAAPRVAVINEAAVRKFFPNENPLGRRFGSTVETSSQIEVIGVVRDAKYNSVRDEAPPTMYVPYTQSPIGGMAFEIRTAGDPSAAVGSIREAVRQADANVPLMNVATQMEAIETRFAQERLFAQAYALFGGLALLVAAVGLFGLMSYSVSRRVNEIGVRMALGARRLDVVRMILRESILLVAAGVAAGLTAALASSRLIAALLYGLQPTDPATIGLAVLVLVAVSALAGYLPAHWAARVDPMVALRSE